MRIRAYADLHLYYQLSEMSRYDSEELLDLQNKLMTDPVDLLVFAGDLTHKIYNTDDIRFVNTMKFVARVRDICMKTNTQFRIIKGTSTHEGKVIEVIQKLYANDPILRAYTEVTYETINGIDFRFLPEPYFDTYDHFYQYAYQQPAHVTFFHGTIDGVIPFLKQTDNPTNLKKSVLMKATDMSANTYLFSAGGHIHKHMELEGNIFYINSLTTHNFSDIDNMKGYMEFNIDENYNWDWTYIPNGKAPKYKRFTIDHIQNHSKDDIRRLIGNILITSDKKDHISFQIRGERNTKAMSNLAFIKSLMRKYNVKIEQKLDEVVSENNLSDTADFYSDDTIPIEEKIQKLTEEVYGMNIPLMEIEEMIK